MQSIQTHELTRYGDEAFFVFCDHAGNAVPEEFSGLGVPPDMLQTHIGWDIGAGDLTSALAKRLKATAYLSQYSRLLIDLNRSSDRADLIPPVSDQVPIPGNKELSFEQRFDRIVRYFNPYHDQLDRELSKMAQMGDQPFAISVHSFTPRLLGAFEDRPWHIGILWRHDEETAQKVIELLEAETDYVIGDNKPYDAHGFNYTIDRHIAPRRLKHLTLEIRQDILSTPEQVSEMADCLVPIVKRL